MDAADIEGAEADRDEIHKTVVRDVKAFERRVLSAQASWAEHTYSAATQVEEVSVFVAAYTDQEIQQARRAAQKSCLEHRRLVRGVQGVYDRMKAT